MMKTMTDKFAKTRKINFSEVKECRKNKTQTRLYQTLDFKRDPVHNDKFYKTHFDFIHKKIPKFHKKARSTDRTPNKVGSMRVYLKNN